MDIERVLLINGILVIGENTDIYITEPVRHMDIYNTTKTRRIPMYSNLNAVQISAITLNKTLILGTESYVCQGSES